MLVILKYTFCFPAGNADACKKIRLLTSSFTAMFSILLGREFFSLPSAPTAITHLAEDDDPLFKLKTFVPSFTSPEVILFKSTLKTFESFDKLYFEEISIGSTTFPSSLGIFLPFKLARIEGINAHTTGGRSICLIVCFDHNKFAQPRKSSIRSLP